MTRPSLPSRVVTILNALLFALPLVVFAVIAWRSRAVIDDAYINFRIIDNILAGQGPVYNVGERIESGTSPAWLAVLALASWMTGGAASLPWLSVWLGIATGIAGLACAQVASLRLVAACWPESRSRVMVPAGACVVAAMRPFAELTACGLETGLTLLWIGGAVLAVAGARQDRRWWWRAVLVGCGPMVRPELALLSVTLTAALAWSAARSWMGRTAVVAGATALPLTVQVLRMGYYGVLVPNTALAKEAFSPFWSRGWTYALDAASPYWLLVPLLPLLVMTVAMLRTSAASSNSRMLVAAVAGGGLVQAVYVIRLGGDFMHARMLLAPIFSIVLPLAMWPASGPARAPLTLKWAYGLLAGVLFAWATAAIAVLRVPYPAQVDSTGIADEVNFYRRLSARANPVTPEDYEAFGAYAVGLALRGRAAPGRRALVLDEQTWSLASGWPATIVTDGVMVGLAGFMAGPHVHIADSLGLTDPIASRLRLDTRGRAGHEKWRPRDWMLARFARLSGEEAEAARRAYPQLEAARRALDCGDLRRLLGAVTEPLTPSRFVSNVLRAARFTRLRIPSDPYKAAAELCDN